MTSFAGGASGFPLCYDNYSIEEKKKVVLRNKLAIKSSVINYLKATSPINYLPYAGMFKEYAKRDEFIKDSNKKNAPIEYEQICNSLNIGYIEPEKNKLIQFRDGVINCQEIDVKYLQKEDYSFYINKYKEEYIYDPSDIISYLKNSGYHSNQILQIIPTNDTFYEIIDEVVFADFKNQVFKIIYLLSSFMLY